MSIDLATAEVQYSAHDPLPAELDTWEPTAIDRAWWAEHSHAPEPYDEALELADIFDEDLDFADRHQDFLDGCPPTVGRWLTGLRDEDVAPYGVD